MRREGQVKVMTVLVMMVGLVLLILGAELLVRNASGLAGRLGISPLVIGLTVVAFGTSSPELAVSIRSAWAGQPDLAMGNVVGSNIFNVLFILGLSALIAPLVVAQQLVRFDVPLLIGVSALVMGLGSDGFLGRGDGVVLVLGLTGYTLFLVLQSRREKREIAQEYAAEYGVDQGRKPASWAVQACWVVAGLGLLLWGSQWLVEGAVSLARSVGISELVIGLTLIAGGTSLPEVATSVMASWRGERDIAVGNVIGSNLFNLLGVLGAACVVAPEGMEVSTSVRTFDLPVMTAVAFACLPIFFTGHRIARWEGGLFLGYYLAYTLFLVLAAQAHDALPYFSATMLYFVVPLTVLTLGILTVRALRARSRSGHSDPPPSVPGPRPPRTALLLGLLLSWLLVPATMKAASPSPQAASPFPVDLSGMLSETALVDLRALSQVRIAGSVHCPGCREVRVRVTTSRGDSHVRTVTVGGSAFQCDYPADFPPAPALAAGALFIDVTTDSDFEVTRPGHDQAEITLLLHGGREAMPDLPSAFTCDLLDQAGRVDQQSVEWPVVRDLVNLFMRSRGARLVRVGRSEFDLAAPDDLAWFKNHLTLYEFDHRDRDWSLPLGKRRARTFWQSVWNAWFNASNNHPRDGDPTHRAWTNYTPYAFANDYADVLITYWMRRGCDRPMEDNLLALCREGTVNLLAMQHAGADNFARQDARGRREQYTAGAFRYGLFETGEYLTEGRGWFYNPKHLDYIDGGVLNGRAVWGLGEALRHDPEGPLAPRLQQALALALKFCLHDGLAGGYTKRTPAGHFYWRDAGEHAYLVLGMLAASEACPDLAVTLDPASTPLALSRVTAASLEALVDLEQPWRQWMIYPNVDAMAVAALAQGVLRWPDHPRAAHWRASAVRVTDAWLAAAVDPQERRAACVHFGLRPEPGRMTYVWPGSRHLRLFYYQSGHWIHALADLYAATGQAHYRERAEALTAYLCGRNPWQIRLFNELGGVYNWTDDTDGDGLEDQVKQDLYPESTAFCQIGFLRLIRSLDRP